MHFGFPRLALPLGLMICTAGCSSSDVEIVNNTASRVVLRACVQDPQLNIPIAPGAGFTFDDRVGRRISGDDPGFACSLDVNGALKCLAIPTDQGAQSTFYVASARPVASDAECFRQSNSHI